MKGKTIVIVAPLIAALIFFFGVPRLTRAQEDKTPYPCMALLIGAALWQAQDAKAMYPSIAPLEQYLMDRNAEVALARSAAPESISRDATLENRSPICFNPPAARTVLPITYMRTKLVLAGKSKAEVKESIKAAIEKKELPDIEAGAISYMLSKPSYLTDTPITHDGAHTVVHLMFYTPPMDAAVWGANMEKSPYLLPNFNGQPEPIDVFIVLTGMWSDGTPAPLS